MTEPLTIEHARHELAVTVAQLIDQCNGNQKAIMMVANELHRQSMAIVDRLLPMFSADHRLPPQ